MKFILKCDEAVHVCDKSQYKEAGIFSIFLLKIHLLMCSLCRGYSRNNKKLTNLVDTANIKSLQPEEKKQMKEWFQQQIKKEDNKTI